MLLQNLASSLSKVLFTTQLASELASRPAVRVLPARTREASLGPLWDASRRRKEAEFI